MLFVVPRPPPSTTPGSDCVTASGPKLIAIRQANTKRTPPDHPTLPQASLAPAQEEPQQQPGAEHPHRCAAKCKIYDNDLWSDIRKQFVGH